MAVAHDATTDNLGTVVTASPGGFTHTPVGTPRGVLVLITIGGAAADIVTGVTYGGVTMNRIATASDEAGETFRAYVYFLGGSIPTGPQSVSVTKSDTTGWRGACVSITAADDTQVVDSGVINGDTADPQVALDSGSRTAIRYAILASGSDALSATTPLTGCTEIASADAGTSTRTAVVQDTPSSGSFTIGYTATSNDTAFVACAVAEVLSSVAHPGWFQKAGWW